MFSSKVLSYTIATSSAGSAVNLALLSSSTYNNSTAYPPIDVCFANDVQQYNRLSKKNYDIVIKSDSLFRFKHILGGSMIDTKKFIMIFISLFLIMYSPKTYALENKEILFISSYNPNFITFKDQVKGIESALGDDYNLQVQYMNSTSDNYRVDENNFYNL